MSAIVSRSDPRDESRINKLHIVAVDIEDMPPDYCTIRTFPNLRMRSAPVVSAR